MPELNVAKTSSYKVRINKQFRGKAYFPVLVFAVLDLTSKRSLS